VHNSICRVLDLPEQGNFQHKFLLSAWNPENIPEGVKNETFQEYITYLKTATSQDGKEIRSYLKKRVSSAGNTFLSYTKRQMAETEKYRLELHRKVDHNIFEEFLKEKDTTRKEISRKVVNIIFEDVLYTVESYGDFAFLRVSTHTENENVNIPDWFGANTNITEEAKYFSYNLSNPQFSA
jgi:CYTH domain-containing protein